MSSTRNYEAAESDEPMHIDVKDLTFGYAGKEPVLRNLNMQLTNGARCLLIGYLFYFCCMKLTII